MNKHIRVTKHIRGIEKMLNDKQSTAGNIPRILISADRSSSGKTTISMGLGDYEDSYEQDLKKRITRIRNELESAEKDDESLRALRHRKGFSLISLAGYTNAGKSTLFNAIVNESVEAKNMLLPLAFVAVSVTVYLPTLEYLCVGFCWVEVVPSPKLHFHLIGEPVLVSLKATVSGAFPSAGFAENSATGFATATII